MKLGEFMKQIPALHQLLTNEIWPSRSLVASALVEDH
jgi:hypothetical protein